ncbi:PREDICTED: presequence protease 1, chloroplastic/mitochondrial [Brassica oleracea var. oleracea]|uniref:Peptidase M16C associated domain-containing protein n=1 Tax=Brassica oleracea var. oleracea TaxID=109376 RepID=A0A0D3BC46_BRAOL|nr:PREDICTED: presequence protease 1, chloroplastic/mitochondrial [Brassica oleracea var. oleracea]
MLRTASCSASLTTASHFFRHFPLSYSSLSSSTGALRAPGRNLRRVASPASPGRRVFLRRGLRVPSTAVRRVNRQLSRLYVRAVATQPARSYPDVGQDEAEKLGFEKVSEEFISECKSKATLFKHKKTGCEVMSVSNEDENKVFGIVLRTPPKDSTGIPHILEHSVLCGSRKYPLKEPFVELLKGSLHTFLNAFTYPDRTCYPVASTNTKDFYNLVDVYLDAVFFPKCVDDVHTFQQEGWHYELNDPSEDISYKGVVFNEMKGVYSQPDNILGRIAQQAISPDNTYGVDSGGDPKDIPNLTFEEFKDFHRKYYHPSNARIWFYGDDDPLQRLRILSEYLDMFEASPSRDTSKIEPQKLFSEPIRIVEKYPVGRDGDLKKKNMVCVNWLLSEKPLDLETQLALGFLDHLMLGTPASPLRKILLESGLGEALVSSGMSDELLQPQFSVGMKGVSEDNVQKVEELIMSTLKKLAEEGFESNAVEASMNTIEFSLRENNTGSFPRGLSLMLQSIAKWIYDMDPFEPLKYTEPLKALKARIAEEGSKAVFSPLIEQFILNNSHRVTIEMQPDPEKASQEEAEEKSILEKVKAGMTEEDLAELARATEELRLKQETPDPPEALRCVPSLNLSDIPKEPTYVPTEVGDINGVKVLRHDLFTNDIVYAEVVFDMGSLKHELLPLVPLFCQSLMEMGTKDLSFVQLNQLIGRKTGGISVYPLTSSVRGKDEPCTKIIVRGKSMAGRADDLFNLMNCLLQEVQFTDQQRFKQFVSQSIARMENRLRGSGHGVAAARMDAMLNIAGWMSEQMGGLSYLEFLRTLEKKVGEDWEGISSSLEEIRRSLLAKNGCIVNMTADGKSLTNIEKSLEKFLDLLPESPSGGLVTWDGRLPLRNEAIVIPTQVNYVGKAGNIYSTGYELDGSAYVISKHISNTWLWDRVRVSGGAYGGFCDFDSHSGVFSFLSYRDPNLLKTLDIYDGTGDFLRGLDVDQETLTKAIIGTIGDVDSYQLPDAKGYSSLMRHLLGVTDEERLRKREEILTTSLKDFKDFAEAIDVVRDNGVAVAVASAEDIDAANNARSNFFEVKKAL